MKLTVIKIGVLLIIIGTSFYLYQSKNSFVQQQQSRTESRNDTVVSISPSENPQYNNTPIVNTSLFVPYWTLDENISQEKVNTLIYFGIAADKNGIKKNDPGYNNLSRFVKAAGERETYLTIRMLDTESNIAVIENTQLQQKIIKESIEIAAEHDFDGIVLDLEISVLPFSNVEKNITSFIEQFGTEVKKSGKPFAVAIYGDVFYRARPFNVQAIAQQADEIIIMAYDFSKSYGEPGPNFPFEGKETYGYDFQTMIADYKKVVPSEKLTVAFGMFGYDWALGPEGKPLKGAVSLTVHQAKSRYLNGCNLQQCKVTRNSLTKETNVTFQDSEGFKHEVWFEDEQSVSKKIEFLEQQGISHISYWAYGYY